MSRIYHPDNRHHVPLTISLSVILGSFSNYLVTKSSVPVMVARKKLRKQHKYKKMPITQVNNITNPMERTLSNAKSDP